MLGVGLDRLLEASREGRAIAAFSTYNLELTQAICRGAEACGVPVILQAGASAFGYAGRDALAAVAMDANVSAATTLVAASDSRYLMDLPLFWW